MKLSAVLLARVIYFVESVELNPLGAAYYPDIINALVERYQFKRFPQKIDDFNEQKGVVLADGKYGDKTIQNFTIYSWGLACDTTSSTNDSNQLLNDALLWSVEHLRLHFTAEMVKRRAHVSHIIFYSDAPLLSVNPILDVIGERISKEVAVDLKLPYTFRPQGIRLGIDPEEQRIPIQSFAVERRDGAAFSEGKYFSSAPVSTDTHLALIEEFERDALKRRP